MADQTGYLDLDYIYGGKYTMDNLAKNVHLVRLWIKHRKWKISFIVMWWVSHLKVIMSIILNPVDQTNSWQDNIFNDWMNKK